MIDSADQRAEHVTWLVVDSFDAATKPTIKLGRNGRSIPIRRVPLALCAEGEWDEVTISGTATIVYGTGPERFPGAA